MSLPTRFRRLILVFFLTALAAIAALPLAAAAQVADGAAAKPVDLVGEVLDTTGASIPRATISAHGTQVDASSSADEVGHFTLRLPPGAYVLSVEAGGFRTVQRNLVVLPARNPPLRITLLVATDQQVDVEAEDAASTTSEANKSALVFKGGQLDTFSDDPATMQQELESIGGADPSNPPQLYVDGFSGGQMPTKDQIREIRINQNPFSAQYDQFGMGRIEIFTKPGGSQIHGSVQSLTGNSIFDARNPYSVGPVPGYANQLVFGQVNGPLGKKTSFYGNVLVQNVNSNAVVNATSIDPTTLQPVQITQTVPANNDWQSYRGRIDRQVGTKDTFIGRYQFNHTSDTNSGVGELVLPEAGVDTIIHRQIVQLSDTHLFSAKVILDTALQYMRTTTRSTPKSTAPSVTVQGSFTGGGSSAQQTQDHTDNLELQEYFSISEGPHFIRAGMRFRSTRDANTSRANYNGSFTFPDLATYANALQQLGTGAGAMQLGANASPTLFQYTAGTPSATILTTDFGLFAEDEWKATKNLTLNYGLRIELQTAIPDHFDPAPRLGFAYAVTPKKAKAPFAVVRGGFGLFYVRFPAGNLLTSIRQNGVTQTQYNVNAPGFYFTGIAVGQPLLAGLSASASTPYRVAANLTSPVTYQGMVSVDRTLGKIGSMSVQYSQRRSLHQFESLNINAPEPGTGVRPMGGSQNVYQFASDGISDGHTLSTNVNLNLGKRLSYWGWFGVSHQASDVGSFSGSSFASNSYNLRQDEGPLSGWSPRQMFTGFNAHPGLGLSVNAFLAAKSRGFFNITTGSDNNGDTIYNDRPAFASAATPAASLVKTAYGNFDLTPQPGETIIPYNDGAGPGLLFTALRLDREFHFGPRPAVPASDKQAAAGAKAAPPPPQRYTLGVGVETENPLNHVNRGSPVGVLLSPDFGKSLSLNSGFSNNPGANRTVGIHALFSF